MRKIALLLAVVILLSVPVNAYAVMPRNEYITADLTFNGRNATCIGTAMAASPNDYIVMRVTLMKGTMCLLDETVTGYYAVRFEDWLPLTSGWEVELRVDVTINGVVYPTRNDIATCP